VGRLEGKVAVISGGARGQGRSHAETLAREGADIVAFDICEPLKYPLAPGATEEQLAETARLVQTHDRRCLTAKLDARDLPALRDLAARTMAEFGRVDILVVNHGIWSLAPNSWELEEESWNESIDILLTGAWKVTAAFIPKLIETGPGGSIVVTGSTNSVQPQPSAIAYTAAKFGLMGLMRVLAVELGPYEIRVNAVNPAAIKTPMVFEGGSLERALEYRPDYIGTNRAMLPMPQGWVEPEVVSDAVLWLVSDEAKWVTGAMIPVDGGWSSS
jgi:(+)-trans-carveol dehydrogenase